MKNMAWRVNEKQHDHKWWEQSSVLRRDVNMRAVTMAGWKFHVNRAVWRQRVNVSGWAACLDILHKLMMHNPAASVAAAASPASCASPTTHPNDTHKSLALLNVHIPQQYCIERSYMYLPIPPAVYLATAMQSPAWSPTQSTHVLQVTIPYLWFPFLPFAWKFRQLGISADSPLQKSFLQLENALLSSQGTLQPLICNQPSDDIDQLWVW